MHINTALESTLDNTYLSVGYAGTIPVPTLETVFMTAYTNNPVSYINVQDLVKDVGNFSTTPLTLKAIIGGQNITVSNDANNFTIDTDLDIDAALALNSDITTIYTQAQIDASLALKSDITTIYTQAQIDAS